MARENREGKEIGAKSREEVENKKLGIKREISMRK